MEIEVRLDIPMAEVIARSDDRERDQIVQAIAGVRLGDVSAQDIILLCRSGFTMPVVTGITEPNNGDYI